MQAQLNSNVSIEITDDNSFKYTLIIPVGPQYDDVFKILESFKSSVQQMKENSIKAAEEAKKEDGDVLSPTEKKE